MYMTQPEQAPFTGDYPSIDEVHQALGMVGIDQSQYAEHVTNPMDNRRGPLDEELARCQSKHLSTRWPVMFKTVVNHLLTVG